MARFTGKKVLITGGTSGFGLEAARMIAEEGGRVAVTGRSEHHLEEARRALPDDAIVLSNDAVDPAAAKELADVVRGQLGGLDVLWLNAGVGKFNENAANDVEIFEWMMNINVRGPVLQMAALIGEISDGGSVLLTSSVSPYLGQAQGAIYGATKASMTALMRSWASDLAGRNIRVNAVAPGPIETNFFESTGMSDDEVAKFKNQVASMVPLGRMGTAAEVAQVAVFLLSGDASYVTGSEYFVDGGMTKR